MATLGMDTHPTSPRTEIDLMTEQELARHLKICRRQLYSWRMAGLIPYSTGTLDARRENNRLTGMTNSLIADLTRKVEKLGGGGVAAFG